MGLGSQTHNSAFGNPFSPCGVAILHEGQYYIAVLNEGALDGVRITRLKWARP